MRKATRLTVYVKPKIYRAIKAKAADSKRGVSELVNEAIELTLREDTLDLAALQDRAKESSRPIEEFLDELKRERRL